MFATSRDILNWLLGVSIFGVAVFICWSLYYLIATMRSVYKVIAQIADAAEKITSLTTLLREKIESGAQIIEGFGEKVNDLFSTIKDKLNNTSSYLMIVGEVLKKIFDFMQDKKDRTRSKKE